MRPGSGSWASLLPLRLVLGHGFTRVGSGHTRRVVALLGSCLGLLLVLDQRRRTVGAEIGGDLVGDIDLRASCVGLAVDVAGHKQAHLGHYFFPFERRASLRAMATACFCGRPDFFSSLMFALMVFWLDPFLRGIRLALAARAGLLLNDEERVTRRLGRLLAVDRVGDGP